MTLDDIRSDPEAYLGETVTISGELTDYLNERFVDAAGTSGLLLENDLLVVAPNAREMVGSPPDEGDIIRVTGIVDTFTITHFENLLDVDFDEPGWIRFNTEPAIAATDMRVIEPADAAGAPLDVSAQEVAENGERLDSNRVTIESVVTDVLGPHAFTVEEGELLVVGRETAGIGTGDVVRVDGTVNAFAHDDIGETPGFDVDRELLEEWDGRPVIVADEVTSPGS